MQKSGSNISPRSTAILTEHPNGAEYLGKFSASRMVQYCRAVDRCFTGSAPMLGELCEAYGENLVVTWLSSLIYDLNEFVGQRQQTPQQSDALAWMLLDEAKQYKLTEVMFFFYRYKQGLQGEFYGGVNSGKVLNDLKKFKEVQGEILHRCYERERIAREEAERANRKKTAITREEYMYIITWEAYYGDEDALDALEAAYAAEEAREELGMTNH